MPGWPQVRLRHDVGAGGRHHGANRTHSNAYETDITRSSLKNLRHALGRRIEVNWQFINCLFSFFLFIIWMSLAPPSAWTTFLCSKNVPSFCSSSSKIAQIRINGNKLVTPHWSRPPATWNQLVECSWGIDAHFGAIWPKFMPCIGAQSPGIPKTMPACQGQWKKIATIMMIFLMILLFFNFQFLKEWQTKNRWN